MDVDNLKENGYDLTEAIRTQGWEGYFECLKGLVYTELVNQFWILATAKNLQVISYVLGHKITISEKSISKLLSHDDSRKQCFDMLAKKSKMVEIATTIFLDGKPSFNP